MTDLTDTQKIFVLSHIYGAPYDGDKYHPRAWVWPEATWFQRRRLYLGLFPSVPKELKEEMKHD